MANGPLYGVIPTQSMYAIATGAIPSYRVVVRDVVDASTNGITAKLPAAATDPILGVANNGIAAVAGDQVHVIKEGRAWGVANAALVARVKVLEARDVARDKEATEQLFARYQA